MKATIQRDLRYVELASIPKAYKAAKEILTSAPFLPASDVLVAQEIKLSGGKKYNVYSAPSADSVRGGNGKASVSTNGWIQVFGREGDWILIQYSIDASHYRFGYISAEALPKKADVSLLSFTATRTYTSTAVTVTDDPLYSQSALGSLAANEEVIWLATIGDWAYVETTQNKTLRGFVPLESINTELCYDLFAISNGVATGNVQIAADTIPIVTIRNTSGTGLNLRETPAKSSATMGLYPNGTKVQVLGVSENWYHVQVDGKTGYMLSSGFSNNQSNSVSNSSSSSRDKTAWSGPVGKHKTAEWPLVIDDYLAVVNNPNPNDRLHLRTDASEKAASLGKYYNGVQVIIDGPVDGEWTKVIVGNLKGYMKSKYLVISGEGEAYPASAMPVMTINNPGSEQRANLYAGQSKKAEVLGTYDNGVSVILMGFNSTWAHVIVDGKAGFMLAQYLK